MQMEMDSFQDMCPTTRLPLRGDFHRQEHDNGFKSNAADDDAVIEHSFFPGPGKHVHGQGGGDSGNMSDLDSAF